MQDWEIEPHCEETTLSIFYYPDNFEPFFHDTRKATLILRYEVLTLTQGQNTIALAREG